MPDFDLFVPLAAATVFTLGGYGIWRAGQRHAQAIESVLGLTFVVCAVMAVLALLAQIGERNGPRTVEPKRLVQVRGQ